MEGPSRSFGGKRRCLGFIGGISLAAQVRRGGFGDRLMFWGG